MESCNKMMIIGGLVMMVMALIQGASATVHTVGDSSGWAMGTDYSSWASEKTFLVGDSLVFNYPSGHSVDEVSAADYKSCATGNSVSTDSTGATTLPLKTAGTHYYICGIPGHCDGGMKLSINVKAASGAAAAAPPSGGEAPKSDAPTEDTTTTSPPSDDTTTTGSPAVDSPASRATPSARTDSTRPSSSTVASPPHVAAVAIVYVAGFKWFAV